MNPGIPGNVEEWATRIRHGEIGLLDLLFLEELIRQEAPAFDSEPIESTSTRKAGGLDFRPRSKGTAD
jgi:hypothetical protein